MIRYLSLAVCCFGLVGCGAMDDGRWAAYQSAMEYRELSRQAEAEARAEMARHYQDEQPTVAIETPDGVTVTVNLAPSIRAAVEAKAPPRDAQPIKQPVGVIAETFQAAGDFAGKAGPWVLPWAIADAFSGAPRGVEVNAEAATFDGSFNSEDVNLAGEGNRYAPDDSTTEVMTFELGSEE